MDKERIARIDEYVEVHERVNGFIGSDAIVATIIEQVGKDNRCALLISARSHGTSNGNGEQPASERQIDYLRSLGANVPAQCTKKAASDLIDKHAA